MNVKRKEIRNASALAGLWSLSQGGETSVKFLSAFLDRLLPANGQAFPCIAELRRGYRLSLEDCPLGEKTERVDLIIEGKNFLIGIEVKIDARLGPEQLERYIKTIERRANHGGQKPYVILLAPFPPNLKDVTHARWKDVERAARSALPRKTADYQYSDRLIESFAVHIHSF